MPPGWWLRQAIGPIVGVAVVLGLGWLCYIAAPQGRQTPTHVRATISGFAQYPSSKALPEPRIIILATLSDGTRVELPVAANAGSRCRAGEPIMLDRYEGRSGWSVLRVSNHACG